MDGTLVDTEKLYLIFWPMTLKELGFTMTREQVLTLRSLGRPFAPAQFKAWFGDDFDYWKARNRRRDLMEAYLDREGVELRPGAEECLRALREKKILTAVATASDTERIEKYLKRTGIYGYFDRFISATEVPEGKPSPDVYLCACEKLGLSPSECVAVEDAPNGILSAYRAGLKVIMVPDQTEPDEELRKLLFARADSLSEVPGLIG